MDLVGVLVGTSLAVAIVTILSIILIMVGYPQYGMPMLMFLQVVHPQPP